MTGRKTRKRALSPEEEFRWAAEPEAEQPEPSEAPVLALLALTDALLASHADGSVLVHSIDALGTPWELCRVDPPMHAMAFCDGELVGASGNRLVRVTPGGTVSEPLELDAPVGAVVARAGRVYAVAGGTVYTFEDWKPVHRTPVPLSDCHDLDVDRRGKHVVVCERPGKGYVVELGTGTVVGHCNLAADARKTVTETYARFSPVTDNLYRASSRAHKVEKLARLGRSGRTLGWRHDLDQPSTWCTPLASSPDGRYVASRQSGVGVLVWDLRTERQVVFAELDDSVHQEKFAKRMRREPADVRPLGEGSVKVTRWKALPERDGEATAVAVSPGARYAATGGRDGTVTVIDVRTRRIERGDGLVRQPACLSEVVEIGDPMAGSFTDGSWVGISAEGELHVVDLATGRASSPGSVDVRGMSRSRLHLEENEIVVTDGREARAFDRRTLAPVWRAEDPLPGCGPLHYSGSELLAFDEPGGEIRLIRRYRPRTGERLDGPPVTREPGFLVVDDLMLSRAGRFAARARFGYGNTYWYMLSPDGEPGPLLPEDLRPLPDGEHAVVSGVQGWQVLSLSDPRTPLHVVDDLEITLGTAHVDLAAGLVAGQDLHTGRLYVWTVDGGPVASFDGFGEARASEFAFTDGGLWLLSRGQERLYRLALP